MTQHTELPGPEPEPRQDPDMFTIRRRTLRSGLTYIVRSFNEHVDWDDETIIILLQGLIDTFRAIHDD
jgi:hypothetical protein